MTIDKYIQYKFDSDIFRLRWETFFLSSTYILDGLSNNIWSLCYKAHINVAVTIRTMRNPLQFDWNSVASQKLQIRSPIRRFLRRVFVSVFERQCFPRLASWPNDKMNIVELGHDKSQMVPTNATRRRKKASQSAHSQLKCLW